MALDWKGLVKAMANHPGAFALGVGVANGFLAYMRNKKIDPKTAVTLATILGLGELSLVMYEPESERGPYSLTAVGVWSVLGVLAGVAPFVTFNPAHGEVAHPALVASVEPMPATTAVSGYHRRPRKWLRRAA